MATNLDRFMVKVERIPGIDCWVWAGATKPNGYGNFLMNGKTMTAHRASVVLHAGAIPDGMVVCHKCDNPSCVNPEHLFVSTQAGNMADMDAKERRVAPDNRGELNPMFGKRHSEETKAKQSAAKTGVFAKEKHPRASITLEIAEKIKLAKGTLTAKQVADQLVVSVHVVQNIWRGKTWQ